MAEIEHQLPAIDVARQLAELGDIETAVKAYGAALTEQGMHPLDRLEAACAVLQYGGDYKQAYNAFLDLYRKEELRGDVFDILTQAFYTPNVNRQKNLYKKNCKLLKKYPYIFRKDFVPFEDLPVLFYPYDDNGVLPFRKEEGRFDAYINVNDPQITHYFFRDLEKPVFASDIFSQYELEYLKDNVRRSDWIARENHIYLHYTNWGEFCAYLALLDMKPLLEDEKFVFLIEGEESLYPIDFKERFGIDYSQCPTVPLHVSEVKKIIWHTQLSTHNGGDFFNEILHGHPNIIWDNSNMFYDLKGMAEVFSATAREIRESKGTQGWSPEVLERYDALVMRQLAEIKNPTEKDAWVAIYLGAKGQYENFYDKNARIVPPLFVQPHFHYSNTNWVYHDSGQVAVMNENYQQILDSGIMHQFKYIKTFTPMRRPTTSHAASVRIMDQLNETDEFYDMISEEEGGICIPTISDNLRNVMLNRSMMAADSDRLFRDSRLVRFEDAKLNPTATFTALAEFLDIPYTETMTYCSDESGKDPLQFVTNVRGFDPAPVYRTYDEYADDYERTLLEYVMRDIYKAYGYGFNYYDGKEMTQEEVEALLEKCTTNIDYIISSNWECKERIAKVYEVKPEDLDAHMEKRIKYILDQTKELRLLAVRVAAHGLSFCNEAGETLHLMKKLEPIPELLEQPLYH